jgi:peptidoglycan hydrolase CwlO-like protein
VEVNVRPITVTVLIAGLCMGLGVSTVAAQSLGEIAKSQKEQRKGGTKGVITDEDLAKRSGGARTAATPSGEAGASDAGSAASKDTGAAGKSDEDPRAKAQKAWEERQKSAQEEIDRLTKQVDDLQQGLGDARNTQFGANRKRVADQLEEARAKLAAAQQRMDDLEEERRREGF